MRLTQIKLSGFKSFVDPTNFQIPGQLVGVVGPNGCGKSNIIDAVRWVLGESKASELRGESMQDVIFNGSSQRKPAGRASVELVFDNASGRAGGQWNQYAELAVKRVLTRDGNSNYYINNQVVRRRDVQDIFLGTGLGPRAYAIIGQGMISRIIEARPEELRVFLEEAAGVSKYKERRRETENRLHDTRENLTRVEDILRELTQNLEKLEGQAVVAQRFRDLEAERDAKQQLLWYLRRAEAQQEQERQQRAIEAAQLELDARTADLRRIEATLEETRAAHYAAGDAVHARQGELYEATSAVNKLEAEIKYVIDAKNRLEAQINQLLGQRDQWQGELGKQETELRQAQERLVQARTEAAQTQARLEAHSATLPALETAQAAADEAVSAARAGVHHVQQALQVESAHQRNAERLLAQLDQRLERLAQERQRLAAPDPARLDALQVELKDSQGRLDQMRAQIAAAEAALPTLQTARNEAHEASARDARNLGQVEARLAALQQVQQSVQSHDKLAPWLEKHGLKSLPRLWQRLHIESGWETALESVLRERIAALEVSQLELTRGFFGDAPPAKLAFFGGGATAPAAAPTGTLVTLASRLQLDDPGLRSLLGDWLAQVYLADSAEDALARRGELPPGGVFVVKAGHLVGRNSVRFYAADSEQSGMLARQQDIERLQREVKALALLAEESKARSVQADAALSRTNQELNQLRSQAGQLTHSLHERQLEWQRLEQQRQQTQARGAEIESERTELSAQRAREEAERMEGEKRFEALDQELAQVQAQHADAQDAAAEARTRFDEARAGQRELERLVQECGFRERQAQERIGQLQQSLQVAHTELERVAASRAGLESERETLSDATARAGLQDALAERTRREESLARARAELDALSAALRAADEQRLSTERLLDPLRQKITELQLKEQAARLNQEQFVQQLQEVGADLAQLEAQLSQAETKPRPSHLQGELNRIHEAIAALGAVNLAALDELGSARERKVFLDAQSADLNEAITTLEDAIRKIDKETRNLLQDTFDAVNRHFGELFPALFGGGEAKLVMTGDEILDAGVQVMAQPPGKKNSTIHLLSGGEKALTATALVFGMFQLNPAPFCLLDEVDAPLDDANTERFCGLVRKMSEQTQFLFISHNKIAMEMAHQLIGVTMQEQGVSRIVAVDMDAAVALTNEPVEKVA